MATQAILVNDEVLDKTISRVSKILGDGIHNPNAELVVETAQATVATVLLSALLELREYRKIHGPLGCDWLEVEK